ncbi:hypothetical protein FGX01_03955, partial [Xylella fastidiosa subsp. multiplex]|nr:hypothetical protein [Xylella fastidiosa subsp. multiplex]
MKRGNGVHGRRLDGVGHGDHGGGLAITGAGVEASVAGKRVQAGADRLMRERGVDVSAFGQRAESWGNEGKTPIYVAIDGQ